MEKKYLKNPRLLLDLGFKDISWPNNDCARTMLFERAIDIPRIKFDARFTHYISDGIGATYKENNSIDFEEFTMSVSDDEEPDGVPFISSESKEVIDKLTKNLTDTTIGELLRNDMLEISAELSKVETWSTPCRINVNSMAEFNRLLKLLGIYSNAKGY